MSSDFALVLTPAAASRNMEGADLAELVFVQHVIRNTDFNLCTKPGIAKVRKSPFKAMVQEFERQVILAAMVESGVGKYSEICERLGIHRNSLRLKMRELKIYVRRKTVANKPRGGSI